MRRRTVLGIVITSTIGLVAFLILISSKDSGGDTLAFALAAIGAIILGLWVHQLGHILAALCVGLKTQDFYFWPFRIYKDRVWKVRTRGFNELLSDAGPKLNTLDGMRWKMAVALLGGPLFTLAASAVALYYSSAFPRDLFPFDSTERLGHPFWTAFGGYFLSVSGTLGLGYFVLTMLPLREYSMFWDGLFLRELAVGGERSDRILAQHALSGIVYEVRPKDWPAEWFEKARDISVTKEGLIWIWSAYYYYLDRGDMEEARRIVDEGVRIADANPELHSGFIRMEKIFLYLWLGLSGLEDARAFFDEYRCRSGDWLATYRAQSMLHISEGHYDKAIEVAVRGRDAVGSKHYVGVFAVSKDVFEQIIARAFELAKQAPPTTSGAEPRQ